MLWKEHQYFKKMIVWWSILSDIIRAPRTGPLLTIFIINNRVTIICNPSTLETQPSRSPTNNPLQPIQISLKWLRCSTILSRKKVQDRAHSHWNLITPQTCFKMQDINQMPLIKNKMEYLEREPPLSKWPERIPLHHRLHNHQLTTTQICYKCQQLKNLPVLLPRELPKARTLVM